MSSDNVNILLLWFELEPSIFETSYVLSRLSYGDRTLFLYKQRFFTLRAESLRARFFTIRVISCVLIKLRWLKNKTWYESLSVHCFCITSSMRSIYKWCRSRSTCRSSVWKILDSLTLPNGYFAGAARWVSLRNLIFVYSFAIFFFFSILDLPQVDCGNAKAS